MNGLFALFIPILDDNSENSVTLFIPQLFRIVVHALSEIIMYDMLHMYSSLFVCNNYIKSISANTWPQASHRLFYSLQL